MRGRIIRLKGTFPEAETVKFEAVERTTIAELGELQHTEFAKELRRKGYKLADDIFISGDTGAGEIEILVGAKALWSICGINFISHSCGLKAQESKIGWLIYGKDGTNLQQSQSSMALALKLEAWDLSDEGN